MASTIAMLGTPKQARKKAAQSAQRVVKALERPPVRKPAPSKVKKAAKRKGPNKAQP